MFSSRIAHSVERAFEAVVCFEALRALLLGLLESQGRAHRVRYLERYVHTQALQQPQYPSHLHGGLAVFQVGHQLLADLRGQCKVVDADTAMLAQGANDETLRLRLW
jgi:hypothetical protein